MTAELTAMTGDPKRYDYTADGVEWAAFEWTAGGDYSITTTEGVLDALLVGAGTKSNNNNNGDGGDVVHAYASVSGGPHDLKVGAANDSIHIKTTTFDDANLWAGGGPGGAGWGAGGRMGYDQSTGGWPVASSAVGNPAGIPNSITGTEVVYAYGCPRSTFFPGQVDAGTPGSGGIYGTTNGGGQDGTVIVRVPASKVSATGGWV